MFLKICSDSQKDIISNIY